MQPIENEGTTKPMKQSKAQFEMEEECLTCLFVLIS